MGLIKTNQSLKNYIINGDMRIAQRGTSFPSIVTGAYSLDRYYYEKSGVGVHTASQDTDVPTLAQAGYLFQNSLRFNVTTIDASLSGSDYYVFVQRIEGYNWVNLAQKTFTLSFWVKATTTGTYCVCFANSNFDRVYVAEYTVNATATWEKKTITVTPSPSAGTWDYAAGKGLQLYFTLASGIATTTANNWNSSGLINTSNQVNGLATASADFRITGMMINEGPVAAPFRLFGEDIEGELSACQRYYEKSYNLDVAPGSITSLGSLFAMANPSTSFSVEACFKVQKRATPTVRPYNPVTGTIDQARGADSTNVAAIASLIGTWGASLDNNAVTTASIRFQMHFTADAEL